MRGDPTIVLKPPGRTAKQPLCSVVDCDRRHEAHGYCDRHYRRWRKFGNPLIARAPLRDDVGYYAMHYRVYAAKGRADEHSCVCGARAGEWSYDRADPDEMFSKEGYPYSTNIDHYEPKCIACHRAIDYVATR